MKSKLAVLCVFFALSTANLHSQNTASVHGTVVDPSGAVIPHATVELKLLPSGPTVKTEADQNGRYAFLGLTPGTYELKIAVPGFQILTAVIQLASAGQRLEYNASLAIGQTAEQVTVNAQSLPLNTSSSSIGRAERIPAHGIRRRNAPRNTEQYDHYVENEFASTKAQPLSTFSVDVDTASYSNVRRFLNQGHLPPPGSVRIEELINYFTYEYPLPDDGKPVSVTSHLTAAPWNSQHQILQIGLRTRPIAAEKLPPSNLTFLIDVSGSMMMPVKLPLVKQALRLLVEQLRPQDRVSLVVYAGNAGVVLPPTPGDQHELILDAIDRLEAGGSTHGSAGIRSAYDQARQSFLTEGMNRVILATDGDFNVGVSSDDDLVRLIEKERESGVFLSVLGFGMGNYKDSKMQKLADHGNGNYAYIDTLSEARKIFVEQMGATIFTVAKDVKLQIEFNPTQVKAYRLIGYEKRILRPEEFNDDKKDAGDLGAGHQVTAIYELIPAGSDETLPGVDRLRYQNETRNAAKARSGELAWLKLRHKAPQSDRSELTEWVIPNKAAPFDSTPADVRFAAAVAEYGMLLRHSQFAANGTFDQALRIARNAQGTDPHGYRSEFLDLVRRAGDLSAQQETSLR